MNTIKITHVNSQVSLPFLHSQYHLIYEHILWTGSDYPLSAFSQTRISIQGCNLTIQRRQILALRTKSSWIDSCDNKRHAGYSVDPFIRTVQASSSLDSLLSVRPGFSYFHSFLSFSIVNIILMSFLMVDTCANFADPFLFFTES